MTFSPEAKAQFDEIAARYPVRRAAIMPALWLAQKEFGWVSAETMEYLSGLLGVSPAYVAAVASFYTMYYKQPIGKHHIQVCTNLSCVLRGAEGIVDCLKERLQIGLGETTADNKFSLSEAECLGSCGTAPMMQVDDDFWENLTPESTLELVDRLATPPMPIPGS